ncbi:lactonase family protein [Phycicoccus duodecadis]|uniref:6-phosphogluconolactonase (Cycloisomerase 2 family) n=1 Tax=Phycicoccus duodecadis TaxID=173053 RepID=A0A2N3YIW1_9MICO|nr:beta-propeller fold lactonase family protein [Phycicoccus duodecadis]PKW26748.1 6-phosphogluconolactonase (cycloisomerase 2 family) [Phycicoccus duodecadis]
MNTSTLYVGSYTSAQDGRGSGVSVRGVGADGALTGDLSTVPLSNPTFLALGMGLLFAVEEEPDGRVVSLARTQGKLTVVGSAPSGGGLPCHLVVDDARRRLVLVNYLPAGIATVVVAPDGTLGPTGSTAAPGGTGPVRERQESPHFHQALRVRDGSEDWLVSDLGGDRVVRFAVRGESAPPALVEVCRLPAGSGPRHMGWVGDALLVSGELDSRLHVLSQASGVLEHVGAVTTGAERSRAGRRVANFPSHLVVSPNQDFAFVANRGWNSIAVFDISRVPRGGMPRLVGEVSSRGEWPRHFTFHRGCLYVANQRSNTIAVFAADGDSGVIGDLVQVAPAASPVCLVFADGPFTDTGSGAAP